MNNEVDFMNIICYKNKTYLKEYNKMFMRFLLKGFLGAFILVSHVSYASEKLQGYNNFPVSSQLSVVEKQIIDGVKQVSALYVLACKETNPSKQTTSFEQIINF